MVGEDRAVNTFEVLIRDKEQLRSVVGKIKGLRGVVSVDRV